MERCTSASPTISRAASMNIRTNCTQASLRYAVVLLVWYERYDDPSNAIMREKQLKKWRRDWKIRLIEESNPEWIDLFAGITG
jgi:predicted GIY-YIG superfamily endonuclease